VIAATCSAYASISRRALLRRRDRAGAIDELTAIDARTVVVSTTSRSSRWRKRSIAEFGSRVAFQRGLVGGEDVKTWGLRGDIFDWLPMRTSIAIRC